MQLADEAAEPKAIIQHIVSFVRAERWRDLLRSINITFAANDEKRRDNMIRLIINRSNRKIQ